MYQLLKQSLFLFLCTIMFAMSIGCSGSGDDSSPSTVPISDSDTNMVYVAGYYNNGSHTVAAYWKNGTKVDLHTASRSVASGIYYANSNVYISGSYNMTGDEESGNLTAVPCYWVDNGSTITKIDLTIGAEASGEGSAIFVSGTDIYMAGIYGTNHDQALVCYWKNGTKTDLTAVKNDDRATGIFVTGTDVYVSGRVSHKAYYWKNNSTTSFALYPSAYSRSTSIFVSGTDVYISGYYNDSPNQVPCYWKNDSAGKTDIADSVGHEANGIFISGTDIYLAGRHDDGSQGWSSLNGTKTALAGTSGVDASSIFVLGTDVYVAGFTNGDTTPNACYWKNGTKVDLSTVESVTSSIFVVLP